VDPTERPIQYPAQRPETNSSATFGPVNFHVVLTGISELMSRIYTFRARRASAEAREAVKRAVAETEPELRAELERLLGFTPTLDEAGGLVARTARHQLKHGARGGKR
jgi:hypothetical protein